MQLRAEAAIDRADILVLSVEPQQFARAPLARLVLDGPAPLLELIEIEDIALETDEGGAARIALLPLDRALFQHEIGRALDLQHLPALGEIGRCELGIARIVDHHAAHRAAGQALAVMEGDAAIELDELPS